MSSGSWLARMGHLPIADHLASLVDGIKGHSLTLLEAPPGSGKTTLLPLALLDSAALQQPKILVLQPRRVAARSVASHMAALLQEAVGETVGYQVRLEREVSPRTRIEVITEGLLARRLISDPDLPGVGAIIFDEFHERSAHADIALAMALEAQQSLRQDLRLVIMSATLPDSAAGPAFSGAWRYAFEGRPHPLEVRYLPPPPRAPMVEHVSTAVLRALAELPGDILVFLPGRHEIERVFSLIEERARPAVVMRLFGEQPLPEQQAVLEPPRGGQRRVILATPVAETSLTIEGVRVVIDSGLHKVARYCQDTGSTLRTERITQDAASQRAGRAARTASGICLRMWSEHDHRTLRPSREPEVLRVDLQPHLLDLACWGVVDPLEFGWITRPPPASLAAARDELQRLSALDESGRVTDRGRVLAALATHPALSAMCLEGARTRLHDSCAALVALLDERPPGGRSADALPFLDAPARSPRQRQLRELWLRRIRALRPAGEVSVEIPEGQSFGLLAAAAFPRQVARRREANTGRYILASGGGAALAPDDPLRRHEFLVVLHLRAQGDDSRIVSAVPLEPSLFDTHLSHLVQERLESRFDDERGCVLRVRRLAVGAITLREGAPQLAPPDEQSAALVEYLQSPEGFARLHFSGPSLSLRSRVAWLRSAGILPEIPDLSDECLRGTLPDWLGPFIPPGARLSSITSSILDDALASLLPWSVRQLVDREAPASLLLPSGRSRPICYPPSGDPCVEVILQDLFGVKETPTIGTRRVPLSLSLLSPARRPVQVTRDLGSFWRTGYHQVRKELRGRYPKHPWPDDPAAALPPSARRPRRQDRSD